FAVASDDFADLGHKLIVATAAIRLADLLGEKGRYAMLRVGVWEMVSAGSGKWGEGSGSVDLDSLCDALVANVMANDGEIVSAHAMFLFDAALQTNDDAVIARVANHLSEINASMHDTRHPTPELSIYAFARNSPARSGESTWSMMAATPSTRVTRRRCWFRPPIASSSRRRPSRRAKGWTGRSPRSFGAMATISSFAAAAIHRSADVGPSTV